MIRFTFNAVTNGYAYFKVANPVSCECISAHVFETEYKKAPWVVYYDSPTNSWERPQKRFSKRYLAIRFAIKQTLERLL